MTCEVPPHASEAWAGPSPLRASRFPWGRCAAAPGTLAKNPWKDVAPSPPLLDVDRVPSSRCGEAQFDQTIQHQIPPGESLASSPARPGALCLKCHLPNTEGGRSRAQVTGVRWWPAGKGSSLPISQSCTTGKHQQKKAISRSHHQRLHTEHLKANRHLKVLRLGIQLKYTQVLSSPWSDCCYCFFRGS